MATVGIIDGKNLRWHINGTAIAQALTCSISFSAETRQSTNKDSTGSWAVNKYSTRSFTGSCEAHMAEGEQYETLWAAFLAGTTLTMEFTTGESGDLYDNCQILVTGLEKTSSNDEDVTFSATFTGTGVPTRDTEL
jgi:predicted secreted protein